MKKFKAFFRENADDETPNWPDFGDIDKDFEMGQTNFPFGQGYPNASKKYAKVVYIDSIQGVDEKAEQEHSQKYTKQLAEYALKHLPWLTEYDSRDPYYGDNVLQKFTYPNNNFTLSSLKDTLRHRIDTFKYWAHKSVEDTKQIPGQHRETWWDEARQKAQNIVQTNPDVFNQIQKLEEYFNYIEDESPFNAQYEGNYPLYVTLYDITRSLGGYEEGGWWYDDYDTIESFRVQNYEQAEKAAKLLYNKSASADLNGQPYITLEREPGKLSQAEPPRYE